MARMEIRGFTPTSLVDWDGKIVSVVYLPECNFRCPYCHNSGLVLCPENLEPVEWEDIARYISDNKDFLDGVCITGGEPTIHRGLPGLIRKIRSLGANVKLDTNGTNPSMLQRLIKEGLVEYVAMDVKAPLDDSYSRCSGVEVDIAKIRKSIKLLLKGNVGYEFRTTVVPRYLSPEDVLNIARGVQGAEKYVLQQFVPRNTMEEELCEDRLYSAKELKDMARAAEGYVKNISVRGI